MAVEGTALMAGAWWVVWLMVATATATSSSTMAPSMRSGLAPPPYLWPLPQEFLQLGTQSVGVSAALQFVSTGPHDSPFLRDAYQRYQQIIFDLDASVCTNNGKDKEYDRVAASVQKVAVSVSSSDESLQLNVDESYTLSLQPDALNPNNINATIEAKTVFGALRALETFSQLISCTPQQQQHSQTQQPQLITFTIEGAFPLKVKDYPRFPHRGVMLDTARNYLPVTDILRTIDGMAYSKLNTLHWHVVDSQSFPIESIRLPLLSQKGAYSPREVYTPQDVEQIIDYGYKRGVRIIPEFDTPGHTTAWGLGYENLTVCAYKEPWSDYCAEPPCGQLDPTTEGTYTFLNTLFQEMTSKFMDKYFHIGSDEVNPNCWTSTPSIAAYMKQHGMSTVGPLVEMFEQRAHTIVRNNNKIPINWEEVITQWNLPIDNTTLIQVWLGASSVVPVVEKGYKVIVSPADYWYLDCGTGNWISGGKSWCDPFKTWQTVYSYEPTVKVPPQLQQNILGGETCVWSETIDSTNLDTKLWPRGGAAAERLWSSKDLTDPSQAQTRFLQYREVLVRRGIRATPVQPQFCRLHPSQCPSN